MLAAGPLPTALAAVLAAAAWVCLVGLAIAAGRDARDGGGLGGWLVVVLAGAAAATCLLAAFLLVTRVRHLLAQRRALRHQPGRHRA